MAIPARFPAPFSRRGHAARTGLRRVFARPTPRRVAAAAKHSASAQKLFHHAAMFVVGFSEQGSGDARESEAGAEFEFVLEVRSASGCASELAERGFCAAQDLKLDLIP